MFGDETEFAKGKNPSVSLFDSQYVIVVWESFDNEELYYRLGSVNLKRIDFGSSDRNAHIDWISSEQKFERGRRPRVASTYFKEDSPDPLWCLVTFETGMPDKSAVNV